MNLIVIGIGVILICLCLSSSLGGVYYTTQKAPSPAPAPSVSAPSPSVSAPAPKGPPQCVINPSGGDPITFASPWYGVDTNSSLCFAPIGQQCCDETELPDGTTGCMLYFGQSPINADVVAFNNGECASIDETQYETLKKKLVGNWIEINPIVPNAEPKKFKIEMQEPENKHQIILKTINIPTTYNVTKTTENKLHIKSDSTTHKIIGTVSINEAGEVIVFTDILLPNGKHNGYMKLNLIKYVDQSPDLLTGTCYRDEDSENNFYVRQDGSVCSIKPDNYPSYCQSHKIKPFSKITGGLTYEESDECKLTDIVPSKMIGFKRPVPTVLSTGKCYRADNSSTHSAGGIFYVRGDGSTCHLRGGSEEIPQFCQIDEVVTKPINNITGGLTFSESDGCALTDIVPSDAGRRVSTPKVPIFTSSLAAGNCYRTPYTGYVFYVRENGSPCSVWYTKDYPTYCQTDERDNIELKELNEITGGKSHTDTTKCMLTDLMGGLTPEQKCDALKERLTKARGDLNSVIYLPTGMINHETYPEAKVIWDSTTEELKTSAEQIGCDLGHIG